MRAASRAVNWSRFALLGSSTILAAVVANTLVYFIGSAQIAILVLMHVAAACVIVGMLTMADG